VVAGTLATISERARAAGLRPPAVLVVGRVVSLRDALDWRARLPLAGLRVLVTRARQQASGLAARLVELGAHPLEYPTIEIAPVPDPTELDRALLELDRFGWVILTSTNGVDAFFERLGALGKDARALARARVAAIGPATAGALLARGIRADWMPEQFLGEAIVAGFRRFDVRGVEVLLARADIAPPLLADGLREQGAVVTEVSAYRTVAAEGSRAALLAALEAREIDLVTLTSSSTVRNLVEGLGERRDLLAGVAVACIGPVTAKTAREYDLRIDVEAAEHTIDGLVRAILAWAATRRPATT
jgi:uroporphyrinogen III methyltransferase / synthase